MDHALEHSKLIQMFISKEKYSRKADNFLNGEIMTGQLSC